MLRPPTSASPDTGAQIRFRPTGVAPVPLHPRSRIQRIGRSVAGRTRALADRSLFAGRRARFAKTSCCVARATVDRSESVPHQIFAFPQAASPRWTCLPIESMPAFSPLQTRFGSGPWFGRFSAFMAITVAHQSCLRCRPPGDDTDGQPHRRPLRIRQLTARRVDDLGERLTD